MGVSVGYIVSILGVQAGYIGEYYAGICGVYRGYIGTYYRGLERGYPAGEYNGAKGVI